MSQQKTLAIVHTSFALAEMLNKWAAETLPGVKVVNIVDDDLLAYARAHGVDDNLRQRMRGYFQNAVAAGADVILNACSSVGETVDWLRAEIPVPIIKIDDAMAAEAVTRGPRIGIYATVESTFGPTVRLIEAKAAEAGREIKIGRELCAGAFEKLMAGAVAEHDRLVTEKVLWTADRYDVLVLAQASMSRLGPALSEKVKVPVLTSPELAFREIAKALTAGG